MVVPVSNTTMLPVNGVAAAACPQPAVPAWRSAVSTSVIALTNVEPGGYGSAEAGRVRRLGANPQAQRHVLVTFPTVLMDAQVKGAEKRAVLGPHHPWRPPE